MIPNNHASFIVFDVCWRLNGYVPPEFFIFMFEYSIWLLQQRSIYISIFDDGIITSQSAFTCSKLTIETLKQGVKYFQS